MHVAALGGSLALRGEEGCEPVATELATQELRILVLEFADHPIMAAMWRFQRALILLGTRLAAYGPLAQLARAQTDRMSDEDRVRNPPTPGRVMLNLVRTFVRNRLRERTWLPDELRAETAQVESALEQLPIPDAEWDGPVGDPWLQSWSHHSPLVTWGIAMVSSYPTGDDLLDVSEVSHVIDDAARSTSPAVRRVAMPVAQRLGLELEREET
jgi:hypothetical protein